MIRLGRLALVVLLSAVLGTSLSLPVGAAEAALPAQGFLQPIFGPWDDIEPVLVDIVNGARRQVLVQAYLLTSKKMTSALLAAHRQGIDVRVLVDAGQLEKTTSSTAAELASSGVQVWVETKYQNAHNKLIIVDAGTPRAMVVTGSFNYTWTAEHKNAENILIARDNPALVARYAENWERHRQDAVPFKK